MLVCKREFSVKASPPAKNFWVIKAASSAFRRANLKVGEAGFRIYKQGNFWGLEIKAKDIFLQEKSLRRALSFVLKRMAAEKPAGLAVSDLECYRLKLGCKNTAKIIAQQIYKQIIEGKFFPPVAVFFSSRDRIRRQFEKHILAYLSYMENKMAQGPFLTTDAIIEYKGGVILVERRNPPLGWALPGGFVDYGESAEEAVKREAKEETGLYIRHIRQFGFYSAPQRDSRFHTASVVFSARASGRLKGGSDAAAARVFAWNSLPAPMAFDHRKIIKDYLKTKSA